MTVIKVNDALVIALHYKLKFPDELATQARSSNTSRLLSLSFYS
jgi:hypothetical protein